MAKIKPEKQAVLPPHNLIGCPCKKLIKDVLEKEPDAEIIELRPEVCMKLKCKYLLRSQHGAYRCSRFTQELRGRKRGAMRATKTLRMRGGDKDGWRYRDLP